MTNAHDVRYRRSVTPAAAGQGALIALVGRPNVGKSTLFNRLVGARKALVSPVKGTTRDCLYGQAQWEGVPMRFMDTGGLDVTADDPLGQAVQQRISRALEQADGFVLVCDACQGLLPADHMIAERLRSTGKPIVVAANKVDHQLAVPPDFFSLGLSPQVPISALHGRGIGELRKHLLADVSPSARGGVADRPPRAPDGVEPPSTVAIVGRQNVGKSSLFNALIREDRAVVSDVPGTTRDAVEAPVIISGETVEVMDTAGLRHRSKARDPLSILSMARAREAIDRCQVALVVLDATQGMTRDDRHLITQVCDRGRGLVLAVNKWDLVSHGVDQDLVRAVSRAAASASCAPVVAVSAKTGFHVRQCLDLALRVARAMRKPWPEAAALRMLRKMWERTGPPSMRGRAVQLTGARWVPGCPPRLELLTTPAGRLPWPYQRALLRYLSKDPRWSGVPVRLTLAAPARGKQPDGLSRARGNDTR